MKVQYIYQDARSTDCRESNSSKSYRYTRDEIEKKKRVSLLHSPQHLHQASFISGQEIAIMKHQLLITFCAWPSHVRIQANGIDAFNGFLASPVKIDDLDTSFLSDDDVCATEVAMDVLSAVQRPESAIQLRHYSLDSLRLQLCASAALFKKLGERFPFHLLHDDYCVERPFLVSNDVRSVAFFRALAMNTDGVAFLHKFDDHSSGISSTSAYDCPRFEGLIAQRSRVF